MEGIWTRLVVRDRSFQAVDQDVILCSHSEQSYRPADSLSRVRHILHAAGQIPPGFTSPHQCRAPFCLALGWPKNTFSQFYFRDPQQGCESGIAARVPLPCGQFGGFGGIGIPYSTPAHRAGASAYVHLQAGAMSSRLLERTSPNKLPQLRRTTLAQRVGPGGDLDQLLGDGVLPGTVVLELELFEQILGIVGGTVHGHHSRALLRRVGL
ncbi:MAG: hypothetical protein ACI80V_002568 [Rhodothermales bacterium]|jgi:hypothetical protein